MAKDNQNPSSISISAMQDYLKSIGFALCAQSGQSLAFRHEGTGTIVTLTPPAEGEQIRAADFLSIKTRLEMQDLVSEDAVAIFNQGRLPVAS